VEEEEELEERAASIWNVPVWESLVVTSPTGEAWKVYPGLHEVSAEFRLTGNTTMLRDLPRLDDRKSHSKGSIRGSDDVLQRKCIVEVVVGQVYGGKISPCLPSFTDEDRGLQRSNVAGSPGEVVQVTVIELAERTVVVGWASCKAEITGRTRRSAL